MSREVKSQPSSTFTNPSSSTTTLREDDLEMRRSEVSAEDEKVFDEEEEEGVFVSLGEPHGRGVAELRHHEAQQLLSTTTVFEMLHDLSRKRLSEGEERKGPGDRHMVRSHTEQFSELVPMGSHLVRGRVSHERV
jgi:hypothetical protein